MARAADVLVETLRRHKVDRAFCVPGESYLALIDSLYDAGDIDMVTTRHEGGAALMAVADAKITGRAGIAMCSRGPGATNASIGIHVAQQDAVPLVLFIGQVARADIGRGAFQEVDYEDFFGGMAKMVTEVTDAEQLPEVVRRAFHTASTGTPGPVVISLPEDMLLDDTAAPALDPSPVDVPSPTAEDIKEICERLAAAKRPLLIAGGQIGGAQGRRALKAVSDAWQLPVAVAWRRQDLFDNTHPHFVAHLGFNMPPVFKERLNEADLVVAIGTRLGDVTTQGYEIPTAPDPKQPLVHVYVDSEHIGRIFSTDVGLTADATASLEAIAQVNAPPAADGRAEWIAHLRTLHAERMKWDRPEADDGVPFGNIIAGLSDVLGEDAILINDAGNFATWLHRLFPFRDSHLFLGATAGAMGFGVPAAVAAGLRAPERQVACLVGDGGFQMTGNELTVAVERQLPVRIFVANNQSLGTIRLYQEKNYPGRVANTVLPEVDFSAWARAFGAAGLKIDSQADVAPVMAQAFETPGPVLVDVKTSLEYLAAYVRMSDLKPS